MKPASDRSRRPEEGRRDLWIPAMFVAFFIGLACLQVWFELLANRTFTGLVTDPAPVTPHAHADPAWTSTLRFTATGPLAGRRTLSLADADGAPLEPEQLVATAERTTRFPQLVPVTFRLLRPGTYTADIAMPLAGPWSIRLWMTGDGATAEHIAIVEVEP